MIKQSGVRRKAPRGTMHISELMGMEDTVTLLLGLAGGDAANSTNGTLISFHFIPFLVLLSFAYLVTSNVNI